MNCFTIVNVSGKSDTIGDTVVDGIRHILEYKQDDEQKVTVSFTPDPSSRTSGSIRVEFSDSSISFRCTVSRANFAKVEPRKVVLPVKKFLSVLKPFYIVNRFTFDMYFPIDEAYPFGMCMVPENDVNPPTSKKRKILDDEAMVDDELEYTIPTHSRIWVFLVTCLEADAVEQE